MCYILGKKRKKEILESSFDVKLISIIDAMLYNQNHLHINEHLLCPIYL